METNHGGNPPSEQKGITPAVVGYVILAIIIALIIWRFVLPL
jgi:hypothetical protein